MAIFYAMDLGYPNKYEKSCFYLSQTLKDSKTFIVSNDEFKSENWINVEKIKKPNFSELNDGSTLVFAGNLKDWRWLREYQKIFEKKKFKLGFWGKLKGLGYEVIFDLIQYDFFMFMNDVSRFPFVKYSKLIQLSRYSSDFLYRPNSKCWIDFKPVSFMTESRTEETENEILFFDFLERSFKKKFRILIYARNLDLIDKINLYRVLKQLNKVGEVDVILIGYQPSYLFSKFRHLNFVVINEILSEGDLKKVISKCDLSICFSDETSLFSFESASVGVPVLCFDKFYDSDLFIVPKNELVEIEIDGVAENRNLIKEFSVDFDSILATKRKVEAQSMTEYYQMKKKNLENLIEFLEFIDGVSKEKKPFEIFSI